MMLSLLLAALVPLETAELAAQAWAVRGDTLGAKMGDYIESSAVHTTDTGATFYTVKTAGGGTIIMTSDDELEPVLAFTDEEADLTTLDRDSPLWAFLNRHVSGMAEALAGAYFAQSQNPTRPAVALSKYAPASATSRWKALIAKGEEIQRNGLPKMSDTWRRDADITDMRVPALCRTKWQQSGNGYNYYTPNNYACGCVATAQAQIMRKHCWPTGEVQKVSKWCSVDGTSTNLTTRGGVFDWANMPFSGGHTDIQRQAVGKLCYDVGVTLNMSYSKGGSGSTTPKVMYSLVRDFDYGGAVFVSNGRYAFATNYTYQCLNRAENLRRIFFSNFDAGLPVSVGIPGHEVLADGYGFIDDLEYVHFNFGWAGISTCWYYIPDLTGAGPKYSYVDDLVYNIMPTNCINEAIVSGRVLDHLGKPLSGITVTMTAGKDDTRATAGEVLGETTTNERGIWSFIVQAGDWIASRTSDDPYVTRTTRHLDFSVGEMWNFRAAKIEDVTLDCPTDYYLGYTTTEGPDMFGNSWGNDIQLVLRNTDYPEVTNTGATFEWHAEGDANLVDEDDFGGLAKESYYGKFWWGSDVASRVNAYAGTGPVGPGIVPDAFSNLTENAHFASFTGIVYRAIHNTFDITNVPAASVDEFVPEQIGAEGFICDTLVRIEDANLHSPTPTQNSNSPFLPDENLKIAVTAKDGKLVVIAGDGTGKGVTTHCYETDVSVDDQPHRLSIRAVRPSTSTSTSFLVWLDRQLVRCSPAQSAFPSRIGSDAAEAAEIRALGFAGIDMEVDNVSHTREKSDFMDEEESVTITLPDSANMTRSVACDGVPVAPTTAGGNQYAVATGVVLTVTYTPDKGWYPTTPAVRTLTVEDARSTIPEEEVPTVHGAYAKIGDVPYGTLEEALAEAKEGDTVVLLADFTSETTQLVAQNLTLDMNEMHLTNAAPIGFRVKSGAKLIVTGVGKMSGDVLFFLDWGADVEIRNGDFSDCNKVILRATMWYLQ